MYQTGVDGINNGMRGIRVFDGSESCQEIENDEEGMGKWGEVGLHGLQALVDRL